MNIHTPHNLDDEALATWLDGCHNAGHIVGYLHAKYVCKVFDQTDFTGALHPADPDKKSTTALKKLAKSGLLQHLELLPTTLIEAIVVDSEWSLMPATQDKIAGLVNARLQSLGRALGRGTAISTKTTWQVWTDAGGRCMYEGCGKNLASIPLYNKSARVGYLAHIIASDPNGPRGNQADSHPRSNDADNIMLMCDEHHRLIDCFAPAEHPADR